MAHETNEECRVICKNVGAKKLALFYFYIFIRHIGNKQQPNDKLQYTIIQWRS